MSTNSFLHPRHQMAFGAYRPEDVSGALDTTNAAAWKRLNAVLELADDERTFDNTVLELTRSTEDFETVVTLIGHHESVLGEPWRASNELASERYAQLANDISFHKGLYQALIVVRDQPTTATLSAPRQKLLTELIKDYERNGVNLDEVTVGKLRDLRTELSEATTKFGQNAVKTNDTTGIEVATEADLAGMSPDFIDACRAAGKERGVKGLWVGYSPPTYSNLLTNCRVRATRRAFYQATVRRGVNLNEALAKRILALRRQQARLLGYRDYADYVLDDRMAKTGAIARTFNDELTERYRDQAKQELVELQDFARNLENDPDLNLDGADIDTGIDHYYADRLRAEQIGIDENGLRDYFQMPKVLEQMFRTLTQLYGLSFRSVDLPSWHADVEVYELRDEADHHIATVWCDWYARPGKQAGAWMNAFYIAERANGTFDLPHLGCVVGNFESPKSGKASRLTMLDIETIWHEFGHFIHHALSRPELREQTAMLTKWDFVEAPSQIMENWVWEPETMKAMSSHFETGEPISSEIIDKLIAGRNYRVASKAMRQFGFAGSDLALHIDYDPSGKQGVSDFVRPIRQQYLTVTVEPDDAMMMSFTHIFAGGYAAGYYGYKWAEVIEADFFSRFQAEGILSAKVGHDYRDKVLARGAEVEPDVMIEDFLGRPSNQDALLKRDGIL